MVVYMLTYFILFYSTYVLGHLCLSMAYGLGPAATTSLAAVLFTAVVVTLWKASGCADTNKEAVWGIFAGFFLWCFFGEFLEHERILSLVAPDAFLPLLAGVLLVSYLMYRTCVSVGMRFALGHFASIWLVHAILINQPEIVKNHNPVLYAVSTPALGLVFIIVALLLLLKTFRARSETARLALLLSSFIFFWATMETLQAIGCLPDYTCYAYWTEVTGSGRTTCALEETVNTKISRLRKQHAWEDQQAENRAYACIKGIPSPHFIDDFAARLEQELQNGRVRHLDETLFYRTMEKSFVMTSASAFDRLLNACIQQFKEGSGSSPRLAPGAPPGNNPSREDVDAAIALIQEHYHWDASHTRDLAGYLLRRFSIQFLTGDDFTQRLEEAMEQETTDILGEVLFCRVMKEHFAATCRTVFRNLMQSHIQKLR